ncbi:hypothetical protein Skr01_71620 [Sphaerisporangium krabiense]|uniref:Uncharacterized protein n=1 Tax=Sphaerisporangium krabiense TaxID=763782 RepID=A0A7W9DS96_9ACTN|nr:hypothetical protein [Sphaerisporangium krabiense]MBB5629303.1 hypothetical protein [Sphaerisporangium krabiense]GII67077.1 hypothetical protein Skr01_71620 [Sphaerisporangium krabiense]
MIYLSAILVVLAFGLLVAGVVTGTAVLVMWSIVVSVLSAVFLMIGALLRRHELFPSGGVPAATPHMPPAGAGVADGLMARPGAVASSAAPPRGPASPVARPMATPQMAHPTATLAAPPAFPATATVAGASGRLAPDAIVFVVPGRKRFHQAGCRQLSGRQTEELTYEEAREEGFSPCTTCLPDGAQPVNAPLKAEPVVSLDTPQWSATVERPTRSSSRPSLETSSQTSPSSSVPSLEGPRPSLEAPRPPVANPIVIPPAADPVVISSVDTPKAAASAPAGRPAAPSSADRPATPPPADRPVASRAESSGEYRSEETRPVRPPSVPPRPAADAPAEPAPSKPTPPRPTPAEAPSRPARPVISFNAPVVPEASSPFNAFQRPDPAGPEPSAKEDEDDDPIVVVAARPVEAKSEPEKAQDESVAGRAPARSEDGAEKPKAAQDRKASQDSETAQEKGSGTVKVIPGTRRYHSSACPLIQGSDPDTLESMTESEAESKGLSHCSVCDYA